MKKLILFVFCGFNFCIAFSQSNNLDFDKVVVNNFPEKIYVQYDKPSYFAGETMWFKIYITHNDTPSTKTKVVSIELLNDSGKIVEKKILPVTQGVAVGNIRVNKEAKLGTYTVKAFTEKHVLLNSEDYYLHPINIYNTDFNNEINTPKKEEPLVYFFPEGGNVVNGIKNMVAFKCSNKFGKPLNIVGEIKDSKGEFVTSFKSMHDGMGLFGFFPQVGEKYVAECIINGTTKKTVSLPESTGQGVTLQVSNIDEKTIFTIDASVVTIDALKPANLVGVQNDIIVFTLPLQLNTEKQVQGALPLNKLPSGVLQLTVLNGANQPLAERLVFVDNEDYKTAIDFKTQAINLNPRQKNSFSFSILDTMPGTFAIAVTEELGDPNIADNILARLLLTESLKGYIHNPAFYFENKDKLRKFYLDLVMLTHGWRRYSWKYANNYPKKEIELNSYNYITFKAKALNLDTKKPLVNKALQVQLKTRDKDGDVLVVNTDSSGIFSLPGMIYEDSLQISVKGKSKTNYGVGVQILSKSLSEQLRSTKTPFYFSAEEEEKKRSIAFAKDNFLQAYSDPKEILLETIEVQVKGKSEKDKFIEKYVRNTLGNAQTQLDLMEKPVLNGLNILEYLKLRLNGVYITGSPGSYFVNYRGRTSGLGYGNLAMNIFLDNFQVEPNDLVSIRAADVALVTVHNTTINGSGAALAIYTKRDNNGNRIPTSSDIFFTYEGFSVTKEFFSPDYSKPEDAKNANDDRVTLYWNPFVNTSATNNTIPFSFYNNDKAKKIKVTIEGMQKDGKLLHFEKIIE